MNRTPIAYLTSRYPAISNAFIHREIVQLRKLGIKIITASINPIENMDQPYPADEQKAIDTTFYVKKAGFWKALLAFTTTLFTQPLRFIKGFTYAVKLGGLHPIHLIYHLFYFAEALLVGKWMIRNHAKHLHVHFANPASTVGLLVAKTFPVTYSITIHGPDEFYEVSGSHLAEKIDATQFIVCISEYARSQLMRIAPYEQWDKFFIVPLGVDPHLFVPMNKISEKKTFEILCVGRLVPAKGQRILIEAFKKLRSEGLPMMLRLIGDGPDRKELEKLKNNEIVLEGSVNQDHIRNFYAQADLFVLPSFAEGKPVVLMEAMSMEIPCISTSINGIPELIKDGRDGMLVPPSDSQALANAIKSLYNDQRLRDNIGKSGRYRILAEHDLHTNVKKLAVVFLSQLQGETIE